MGEIFGSPTNCDMSRLSGAEPVQSMAVSQDDTARTNRFVHGAVTSFNDHPDWWLWSAKHAVTEAHKRILSGHCRARELSLLSDRIEHLVRLAEQREN